MDVPELKRASHLKGLQRKATYRRDRSSQQPVGETTRTNNRLFEALKNVDRKFSGDLAALRVLEKEGRR